MQQRPLLAVAFGAFILGIFLGVAYFDSLQQMMQQFFEQLQNKIGPVTAGPELFVKIFVNNALAALTFIATGLFFGIYPFFGLVINGMALGYLWQAVELAGQAPWKMFVYGILPHGIFEIPAIVLAGAFGMRIGVQVWQSLWGLLRPSSLREPPAWPWRRLLRQLPLTLNLVLGLLLVAAIIESSLTLWLVQQFVDGWTGAVGVF